MAKTLRVMSNLPVVVILGATGAGKSKLALELAVKFNGEIISTDSMQVYKKLDILANKVTAKERQLVPHHMIDFLSPLTTNYTVVNFRNSALPIIDDILSRHKVPVIVGGTNYYIEALLWKLLIDPEEVSKEQIVTPSGECSKNKLDESSLTSGECGENEIQATDLPPDECGKNQTRATDLPPVECSSDEDNNPAKKLKTDNSSSSPESKEVQGFYRDSLEIQTTDKLYSALMSIDSERAKQLHPHDRRKILRSLEVFHSYGQKMSDILKEQKQESQGQGVSGPLRYRNPCIIWVKCDQTVLDSRTDKRVDEMIQQGLMQELTDFHEEYIKPRLEQNKEADYAVGIFRGIGLEAFHGYLMMSETERLMKQGKQALDTGIEDMKRGTRQYSRRQIKWMVNRFLKRRGSSILSVYAVDSTDPSKWDEVVYQPASLILEAFIKGEDPPFDPLPIQSNDNIPVYETCDTCGKVFLTSQQWDIHLQSRRHKKKVEHHRNQQRRGAQKYTRPVEKDQTSEITAT